MASQALAPRDQGTAPMNRAPTEYDRLRNQLASRADDFRMALPSHISPEKLQRTIMTAVQTNPELLKADRASLITASMKAAQDGLLPDGREAALVVYKTRRKIDGEWMTIAEVQYQSMVYGVRKKVLQSREVKDINAFVVYRAEEVEGRFHYEEGTERTLRHKPKMDLTEEEARDENIIAAYSMATYNDGSHSYKVLRRFEIDKRRQMSKTGAIGMIDRRTKQPIEPSGPWVDWYPEQAMKTVLRNHSKTLPSSGDILPDVEEIDDMMAARSTERLLSLAEPEAPRALPPTREEVAAAAGADPETGEIPNDDEPDEETARALDRDGFAAMEGRDDADHGDQHDGRQSDEDSPAEQTMRALIDRCMEAKKTDIPNIEAAFMLERDGLDEAQQRAVEAEITAARKRTR